MKHNNWLVVGPGRTGSLAIVRALHLALRWLNPGKTIKLLTPHDTPHKIKINSVVHSHNVKWLTKVRKDTGVIISTRDPVESALSWAIQPGFGLFHFFNSNDEHAAKLAEIKTLGKKMYVDPEHFLSLYNDAILFYKNLPLADSYYILRYEDWCKESNMVLHHLGISMTIEVERLPAKNPGKHSDWISNWDEIELIANGLSRDIPLPKNNNNQTIFTNLP
jgi:hypothetical protein